MAEKKLTYNDLLKMAERYGVSDNVMFTSACSRYIYLMDMTAKLKERIDRDGLMIEKINVKGGTNLDANPLITQVPKYMEVANKTLSTMLDVIQKLGKEKQAARFGDMKDE